METCPIFCVCVLFQMLVVAVFCYSVVVRSIVFRVEFVVVVAVFVFYVLLSNRFLCSCCRWSQLFANFTIILVLLVVIVIVLLVVFVVAVLFYCFFERCDCVFFVFFNRS